MALTKISRGLLDTGVSDSSDSTAITIDSSENVGIGTSSPTSNGGFGTPLLEVRGSSGGSLLSTNSTTSGEGVFTTRDDGINISMAGSATASTGNNIVFRTGDTDSVYNSTERMRIDSSGNVGIGTSPARVLDVRTSLTSDAVIRVGSSGNIGINENVGEIEFYSADPDDAGVKASIANFVTGNQGPGGAVDGNLTFSTTDSDGGGNDSPAERMRIDGSGNLYFNRTVSGFNNDGLLVGQSGGAFIYLERSVAGNSVLYIHRRSSDGELVSFYQGNSLEGNISVSGTTVSYNGFCGTHDSSGTGVSSSTQVGTVLSTIDAEHKTSHAKVKVSDTEGDARVYGVLQQYKEEETNDDTGNTSAEHAVVASVGIGSVLVTGACNGGDLLESNGDGTAKVQDDDIIRSKTIGKVTIGNSDTGVKLVSCVLYCG